MDPLREDVRDFLQTRRARLTPEDAGIAPFGGRRRVPGLRREEVALLPGGVPRPVGSARRAAARQGVEHVVHPVVGELFLDFDAFTVDADSSLRLTTCSARPDSRDAESLALLASHAVPTRNTATP